MALADRLDLDPARTDPLGVQELLGGLADQERRLLQLGRFASGVDDVSMTSFAPGSKAESIGAFARLCWRAMRPTRLRSHSQ